MGQKTVGEKMARKWYCQLLFENLPSILGTRIRLNYHGNQTILQLGELLIMSQKQATTDTIVKIRIFPLSCCSKYG